MRGYIMDIAFDFAINISNSASITLFITGSIVLAAFAILGIIFVIANN